MDEYTRRLLHLDRQLDPTSLVGGLTMPTQLAAAEAAKRAAMLQGNYALAAEYEQRLSTARAQLAYMNGEERRARERTMLAATGGLPWPTLAIGTSAFSAFAPESATWAAQRLVDHYPFLSSSQNGLRWGDLSPSIAAAVQELEERRHREAEASRYWDEARRLAEAAVDLDVGATLSRFTVMPQSLAERIALGQGEAFQGHWGDPLVAEGLARASAFSNMLASTGRIDAEVMRAATEFRQIGLPGVTDTALARAVLNAGGLHSRSFDELFFPSRRILRPPPTKGEKRRALNKAKKQKRPTKLHLQAATHIGTTEGLVRDVIEAGMQLIYGSNWEDSRLPLCDCKSLLGKVKRRGGTAMEHADWADYERIICHPEHFEAVFSVGFDDVEVLRGVLVAVKQDRARALHFNAFTADHLAAVRTSCKVLETGLMELLHPFGLGDDDAEDDEWQVVAD